MLETWLLQQKALQLALFDGVLNRDKRVDQLAKASLILHGKAKRGHAQARRQMKMTDATVQRQDVAHVARVALDAWIQVVHARQWDSQVGTSFESDGERAKIRHV